MKERHQILLEPWQVKYLKEKAEKHNISLCKVIRVYLDDAFLHMSDKMFKVDYDDLNHDTRCIVEGIK